MSGVALEPEFRLGFHGKIPLASDFVTRRLPRTFVDGWDLWLQQAIRASQDALEPDWLDAYLHSPVWRFALSPGLCGEEAFAGVLAPSVDKVGRYFPLALVGTLEPRANIIRLLQTGGAWFDTVEALAFTVLEQDIDIDQLDEAAQAVAAPPPLTGPGTAPVAWTAAIRLGYAEEEGPAGPLPGLLDGVLRGMGEGYSLWWTARCDGEPSLLVCRGLPAAESFTALLDGGWERRGWTGAVRRVRVADDV